MSGINCFTMSQVLNTKIETWKLHFIKTNRGKLACCLSESLLIMLAGKEKLMETEIEERERKLSDKKMNAIK